MKPDVKAKWIAALRSGEYQQAHGVLSNGDGYCCLGVLCDIAVKERVIPEPVRRHGQSCYRYGANNESTILPDEVTHWAGLNAFDPVVGAYALSEWNDSQDADFTQIADLIEEEL